MLRPLCADGYVEERDEHIHVKWNGSSCGKVHDGATFLKTINNFHQIHSNKNDNLIDIFV